jgi:hypothetical protein
MPGMKSLVGMGGSGNARELAEMLRQLGRGRDTVLAHITPEEAQMLMDAGGSGDINPNTGLPEFQEDYGQLLASEFNQDSEFDPYMGQAVTSARGGISPEAEAYYTQNAVRQAPGQSNFGPADQFFGQDFQAQPQAQPEMDIGFGPGRFAPEYTPRDVAGMAPDQFQRQMQMAGVDQGYLRNAAQAVEDTAAQARELARQYPTVAKMLGTGATTLPALINAIRSRREAEKSAAELRALGAPLRAQGEALRQQALAGQLTPQQAAQQEAARARLRQAGSTRGTTTGTQAGMIEGQLGRQRAQLSETNLNNAIRQLNLANAYDEAAIRAKLAADRDVSDTLGRIYTYIGQQYGGTSQQNQTPPAPPAATTKASDAVLQEKPVTPRPGQRNE